MFLYGIFSWLITKIMQEIIISQKKDILPKERKYPCVSIFESDLAPLGLGQCWEVSKTQMILGFVPKHEKG